MFQIVHNHNHYHYDSKEGLDDILKILLDINLKLKQMALTNQQLLDQITEVKTGIADLSTQLTKVNTEVTAKLKALEDAIANDGNVSTEVETAFGELKTAFDAHKTAVQGIDDLIPDTTG